MQQISNHDNILICYQQQDSRLCLSAVHDVCNCRDNCLLSCNVRQCQPLSWPGAPSCPLTRMMAGAGPGHSQGFVSSERSHAGWWLICVQCPHWGWHDGLSRRRQLISALHHIPGLVIHQTESCICIINCCSFTVCFPNCPLCPWAVGTHVQLSRNLYKTLYREM